MILGLGDCRPPNSPGPSLHPTTVFRRALVCTYCLWVPILGFSALGAVWIMKHYTYQSRSTIAHTELVSKLAEENGGPGHGILGWFFYLLDISVKMRYRSALRPLSLLPVFALDSTYCGVGKVHPIFSSYLFLCNSTAPHIFQQITHIFNFP